MSVPGPQKAKVYNITDNLIAENVCCSPWWTYNQQWTSTVSIFALTAFALFNVLKVYSFFFNLLSFIFMLDRVNPTFLVERKGTTEFLTIEPMIKFDRHRIYKKYINNDGLPTSSGRSCQLGLKCLAFVHWTLVFTGRKFLICDVQG